MAKSSKSKTTEVNLPANTDMERMVLGQALINPSFLDQCLWVLTEDDFFLEKHKTIWKTICAAREKTPVVDYVTLLHELESSHALESVGGASYVVSLEEGMPKLASPMSWVDALKKLAARRKLIELGSQLVTKCQSSQPDEVISLAYEQLTTIERGLPLNGRARPVSDIISTVDINELLGATAAHHRVKTGLKDLDTVIGGIGFGDMVVVGARPGMGKTSFAVTVMLNCAHAFPDRTHVYFSMEMSNQQILERLVSALGLVDLKKMKRGELNAEERTRALDAANRLSQMKIWIDDSASINVGHVRDVLNRVQAEGRIGLVAIDYLQLMSARKSYESRVQEVGAIARGLKRIAREFNVPMLALSQLSRACEHRHGSRRPQLSDLRESGDIEAEADIVLLLYREEMYKPQRSDVAGLMEIIVAKNRHGPVDTVEAVFRKKFCRIDGVVQGGDNAKASKA